MSPSRIPHTVLSFLALLLLITILTACGGGDDTPGPRHDLQAVRDALAEAEAEQRRIEEELAQSEQERQRLQDEADNPMTDPDPQPEPDPQDEEEVPNPYNIPAEWVWHNGQFIPADQVPVEEDNTIPASSIYLAWDYHSRPSPHDFGNWAAESTLHVDLGHVEFGIGVRDGEYVPWMRGELPIKSLYANQSQVRRTYDEYGYWTSEYSDLRWEGSLVGLTPDGQSVRGNATLSDFDFTGHKHRGIGNGADSRWGWDPGKAYLSFTELAYEDGSVWGDGDLEYEVGIGNTFGDNTTILNHSFSHPFRRFNCSRSPTGCQSDSPLLAAGVRPEGYSTTDAGEVRGIFFGQNHEAMGGTLKREDLTAAFGGER